jgi:hypothetical protein
MWIVWNIHMKGLVTVDSCYPAMRMSLVKLLGLEVDHLPAPVAGVKTVWICTSARLYTLTFSRLMTCIYVVPHR